MKDMIGCCGLDCEKCDAYLATIHDDNALREKTAALWSELNHVAITPDMINCTGCRVDGPKTIFCGQLCETRKCALGKGHATCGDCPALTGCPIVGEIHKASPAALENLK